MLTPMSVHSSVLETPDSDVAGNSKKTDDNRDNLSSGLIRNGECLSLKLAHIDNKIASIGQCQTALFPLPCANLGGAEIECIFVKE
jgi:hypothetical protein